MATTTQYDIKEITALDANTTTDDSDLYVLGNAGTSTMRKITFSTLASAILNRLTSTHTFSSLTTTSKYLPGAINEVNAKNTLVSLRDASVRVYANSESGVYNYATVSTMNNYRVVYVAATVANTVVYLPLLRTSTRVQYFSDNGLGNTANYVRGGFYADWTNSRIGVRYLELGGAYTYQNVYFDAVFGLA